MVGHKGIGLASLLPAQHLGSFHPRAVGDDIGNYDVSSARARIDL